MAPSACSSIDVLLDANGYIHRWSTILIDLRLFVLPFVDRGSAAVGRGRVSGGHAVRRSVLMHSVVVVLCGRVFGVPVSTVFS